MRDTVRAGDIHKVSLPRVRPILSVVIVSHNSAGEICPCLASIPREIDTCDVEIIVVDSRSADQTAALVQSKFSDVQVVALKENLGFGRSNNIGYEMSCGEFVLFLNPDTVSNQEVYEHCLGRLREDSNIGVISPKLLTSTGEMDLACRRSIPSIWDGFCRAVGLAKRFPRARLFSGYNLGFLPDDGTYDVGAVNGAFMMCPRRALLRFGVFDEQFFMYGDDLDLCYRCQQAGYRVVYDGRVSMIHLKGMSSSQDPERMGREVFRGTKQFYLKHFNPHRRALVRLKYDLLFGAWELLARLKAGVLGHRKAQPL